MRGMREDDLNFFVTVAGMLDKKCQPFGGEERHIAAEDEIPFGGGIGGGGMLERGDDAAKRPFARPAIFNDFEVTAKVGVILSTGNHGNFRSAGLRELNDFEQQWNGAKANQGFVAAEAGTGSARENVAARV